MVVYICHMLSYPTTPKTMHRLPKRMYEKSARLLSSLIIGTTGMLHGGQWNLVNWYVVPDRNASHLCSIHRSRPRLGRWLRWHFELLPGILEGILLQFKSGILSSYESSLYCQNRSSESIALVNRVKANYAFRFSVPNREVYAPRFQNNVVAVFGLFSFSSSPDSGLQELNHVKSSLRQHLFEIIDSPELMHAHLKR
jgi:hypothetical protein